MLHYVIKRILSTIPVLFFISVIIFFSVRLVPGDFATVVLGTLYTPEAAEALRVQFGLDQPLVAQYFIWLTNLLRGDFGFSFVSRQPVIELLQQALPVTLQLTLMSLLFATFIGIPLGYTASFYRNRQADSAISTFGLLGISIPNYWLGSMMILLFSLSLGFFPSGGFVPISQGLGANLHSMVMPTVALGSAVSAVVMRASRSAMTEVLDQEYIKMARAKGVGGFRLIFAHSMRNTMINIVTVIGLQAGSLLGGSVVIERIFSLPGIGSLALRAISSRDYLLVQGTVLWITIMFVTINLIVDLSYSLLNPQIKYKGG